jgi:LysM repeat protein
MATRPSRSLLRRTAPAVGLGSALVAALAFAGPTAFAHSPAPAGTSAQTPAPGSTYVVVPGDTVSGIALRSGVSVGAIIVANGLDSRALIRIGQVFTIPGGRPSVAAPASPTPAHPAQQARTHTVVAGDTVSGLAYRYDVSISRIIAANGLDSRALIRLGQRLTIPGPADSAAPLVGDTFLGRTYPQATVASANENKAALLAADVPSRAAMQGLIRRVALILGVDPALAQAVAYQESGFNQRAVSPANAIGAMQVIPSSGTWASTMVGRPLDLREPLDNATAGVAILRQLLRSTDGDVSMAIAGYYQGLAGVRRDGMYPDTERYVANVESLMTRFG